MSSQSAYFAFLDSIDNSVAGEDEYGNLRSAIECSSMANAEGECEAMYASALESAKMILDCWADFYPQLVLREAAMVAAPVPHGDGSSVRVMLENNAGQMVHAGQVFCKSAVLFLAQPLVGRPHTWFNSFEQAERYTRGE